VLSPADAPDNKSHSALTVAQRQDLQVLPSKHSRPDQNDALQRDQPPRRRPERQTQDRPPQPALQEARGHKFGGEIEYGKNSTARYGDTHEVSTAWEGRVLPSVPAQTHTYEFRSNAPDHSEYGNRVRYISEGGHGQDAGS
jgi:hypothetical protein